MSSSSAVSFKTDNPEPTAPPSDPRKDLLLNGSIDKLPVVCDSMEDLLHEVRKYSDNDSYFLHIFPLFLDRVFGENVMVCAHDTAWVKGDRGGWLRRAAESTRTSFVSHGRGYANSSGGKSVVSGGSGSRRVDVTNAFVSQHGMSEFAALLLHLFVPEGSVCKMIHDDQYYHHLLSASVDILPKKVKMKLQGLSAYQCVRSSTNHSMYDHWCQRSTAAVSNLMSSPVNPNGALTTQQNVNNIAVNLSLQSYFFVTFLRYPTVDIDVFPERIRRGIYKMFDFTELFHPVLLYTDHFHFRKLFNDGGVVSSWMRGNPYMHLLGRYLEVYIPRTSNCSPASHDPPAHNVEFLQLAIDYWIDSVLVIKHDFDKLSQYKDEYLQQSFYRSPTSPSASSRLYRTSGRNQLQVTPRSANRAGLRHSQQYGGGCTHPAATDVITLENISNKAFFPTKNTMQCIYVLLYHCMARMTSDFLLGEIHIQTSSQHRYNSQASGLVLECLPLPHTMMALQQPLFDMLRVIFKADTVDQDIFLIGVQIWQLWLTPWRRVHRQVEVRNTTTKIEKLQALKRTVSESFLKENVKYESRHWQYYVASNLHYYTTLFVLFMRSPSLSRILGESTNSNGVHVLSKTLDIYSSSLLDALDALNKGYELSMRDRGLDANLQDMANAKDIGADLYDCITLQDHQLFPGLPSHESRAVVDFRVDIREQTKIIVEVLRGRRSDSADQGYIEVGVRAIVDGFMTLCGLQVDALSSENFHEIKDMESTLCQIAHVKASDLTGLSTRRSGQSSTAVHDADRYTETSDDASLFGTLTPEGKEQVLNGQRMCKKSSIMYRKDPLSRPLLSTDIKVVVKWLVRVSKRLNEYYDLPACKDSVFLSWYQMTDREVYRYETKHGTYTGHNFFRYFYLLYIYVLKGFCCLPLGVRFNVRFIGNVIFLCKLCCFVLGLLYYLGKIGGEPTLGLCGAVYVVLRLYGWHEM